MSSISTAVNKVLGSGKIYFNDGKGLRYLGDTPGFDISIATKGVQDMSNDTPVAETDLDVVTEITRSGTLTLKNVSGENLALFLIGTLGDVAQSSGAVTGETYPAVHTDRYIQLGVTNLNPTGVRGISVVTVKNDASPPVTYADGTDYTVDLTLGRLYLIEGGAIVDGVTNLVVGYTKASNSREQVVANSNEPVIGELQFIADNIAGTNRDVYGPRVKVTPNGKFVWKDRQTVQSASFDLSFLKPTDGSGKAALYIDQRPA